MRNIMLSVVAMGLFGAGDLAAQANPTVNADIRESVVEGVATRIEENFYDAQLGTQLASQLRAQLASGDYDDLSDAAAFSQALTDFLQPFDTHFGVRYYGQQQTGNSAPIGSPADPMLAARRANFGFDEVSILPGNVGYINMQQFFPAQIASETAIAALDFIQHTDAVIFDMRENRGGAPSMVQLLISHFLDPRNQVPINTFMANSRAYPAEMLSLAYLPSVARPDVPLYVLTSGRTGSAGEAFPYHLQAMERATIVGETTYGAGNPGGVFPAGEGYGVFVSTSQTRNPITGTNWEDVGVVPDVPVAADDALNTALLLAYDDILEDVEDPGQRQLLEWAQEELALQLNPPAVDVADFADIVGDYGQRSLALVDGVLSYHRGAGSGQPLIPAGQDRFLISGLEGYRLTIQRENGEAVSMTLQQAGGGPRVFPRG